MELTLFLSVCLCVCPSLCPSVCLSGTTPSTLVFEIQDGRHIQHRVALNVEHARQFRKQYPKSKKLHIYLDHTFLAVQVRRRQHCVVCRESITILFGKHGYQCRGECVCVCVCVCLCVCECVCVCFHLLPQTVE